MGSLAGGNDPIAAATYATTPHRGQPRCGGAPRSEVNQGPAGSRWCLRVGDDKHEGTLECGLSAQVPISLVPFAGGQVGA